MKCKQIGAVKNNMLTRYDKITVKNENAFNVIYTQFHPICTTFIHLADAFIQSDFQEIALQSA